MFKKHTGKKFYVDYEICYVISSFWNRGYTTQWNDTLYIYSYLYKFDNFFSYEDSVF